jgi:hypothetical protein
VKGVGLSESAAAALWKVFDLDESEAVNLYEFARALRLA